MKTTVDISDAILDRLRRKAAREGTTLRALIHAALRRFLAQERPSNGQFKLKDGSVTGKGPAPGVREGDWRGIRDLIYEGRGA